MQVSAEIRWFWPATPPSGLEDWFRKDTNHAFPAGGGRPRTDEYLRDSRQVELGLKRRGNKKGIEVKGLVTVREAGVAAAPFVGPIEIWTKWTSEPLELNPKATIATEKWRWLRKFDTTGASPQEIPLNEEEQPKDARPLPARGCNLELTQVKLPNGEVWWTLGFEAFGTIGTVEDDLRAVAATLASRHPPEWKEGQLASYPAWLKDRASGL